MKKHLKLICVIGFFVLLAASLPVFLHLSGNQTQKTGNTEITAGSGAETPTNPDNPTQGDDTAGSESAGEPGIGDSSDTDTGTSNTSGTSCTGTHSGTSNTSGSSGSSGTHSGTSNTGSSSGSSGTHSGTSNTGSSSGSSGTHSGTSNTGGSSGTHSGSSNTGGSSGTHSGTSNTGGSSASSGTSAAETPQAPTLHEQNQALIQQIYNTYGYHVSYNDGENFWYNGEIAPPLTDEELAQESLNTILRVSAMFPSGFFRTFQGENGYRVMLVSDLGDAAGVTSYEFGDDNVIVLDVNTSFLSRVFFHETFHVMEQYIYWQNASAFDSWNSLNPAGFSYGTDSSNRYTVLTGYGSYTDIDSEVSFVSVYAKESPREDRAELFADLMFRPYQQRYMSAGFGINSKAAALAGILRSYFPNSAGARWENWITF